MVEHNECSWMCWQHSWLWDIHLSWCGRSQPHQHRHQLANCYLLSAEIIVAVLWVTFRPLNLGHIQQLHTPNWAVMTLPLATKFLLLSPYLNNYLLWTISFFLINVTRNIKYQTSLIFSRLLASYFIFAYF